MLSSVGSTCTPSKISEAMSYFVSWSWIRFGMPVPLIVESVTMSTRLTLYWLISNPISSSAPAPNFSGGAPQVKIVSSVRSLVSVIAPSSRVGAGRHSQLGDLLRVVAEHHRGVALLGDAAQLLDRGVPALEVVDDGSRHRRRPVT